jgi:enoyl-CoA hydratase/carnithine racemase
MSQALEWVYTGEILTPEQALAGRYVKAVVPADQLLEEAYNIARRIAQHSPVAIALTRQMMYRNAAQDHPIEAHKVDSLAIFYTSLNSGKEGVQSFLEKRPPTFTERTSTDMPEFYPWWK